MVKLEDNSILLLELRSAALKGRGCVLLTETTFKILPMLPDSNKYNGHDIIDVAARLAKRRRETVRMFMVEFIHIDPMIFESPAIQADGWWNAALPERN